MKLILEEFQDIILKEIPYDFFQKLFHRGRSIVRARGFLRGLLQRLLPWVLLLRNQGDSFPWLLPSACACALLALALALVISAGDGNLFSLPNDKRVAEGDFSLGRFLLCDHSTAISGREMVPHHGCEWQDATLCFACLSSVPTRCSSTGFFPAASTGCFTVGCPSPVATGSFTMGAFTEGEGSPAATGFFTAGERCSSLVAAGSFTVGTFTAGGGCSSPATAGFFKAGGFTVGEGCSSPVA
ncbi:hypothetical protein BHE74_00012955 [Ensete ventricosum]|nr:hypothetical protein GW17_00056954 [Ensete ventricosum]RWW78790.1 hypothetical protein BHE74_00012955 [Ensete ventricosum]RZR80343.1 hypothetical protein BHM03_00006369 [Ensete ventricosum]